MRLMYTSTNDAYRLDKPLPKSQNYCLPLRTIGGSKGFTSVQKQVIAKSHIKRQRRYNKRVIAESEY